MSVRARERREEIEAQKIVAVHACFHTHTHTHTLMMLCKTYRGECRLVVEVAQDGDRDGARELAELVDIHVKLDDVYP